jgi:hypothetical protein
LAQIGRKVAGDGRQVDSQLHDAGSNGEKGALGDGASEAHNHVGVYQDVQFFHPSEFFLRDHCILVAFCMFPMNLKGESINN